MSAGEDLLVAHEVVKRFPPKRRGVGKRPPDVRSVDGVSLAVRRGETLALVGESGCGKSTLARCLIRLYELTSGTVTFDGVDISTLRQRELRPLRRDMQLVFQDPFASLNPRRRIGDSVGEGLRVNTRLTEREIVARMRELFETVGLRADQLDRYPHEFSGGQRQRVGIARALVLEPKLIVADEPVSALDVSVQAQILNLMADLQEQRELTYLVIAHDLGVVNHIADRVAVMYLGRIVELADTEPLFGAPAHPYTEALLSAVPTIEPDERRERIVLRGDVPSPAHPPAGCHFHPRCRYATDRCRTEAPALAPLADGRLVACHHPRTAEDAAPAGLAGGAVTPPPAAP